MNFDNGRPSGEPGYPPELRQEQPNVLRFDPYSGKFFSAELSRFVEKYKHYVLEDASVDGRPFFRIYGPFQLRGMASHVCQQLEKAKIMLGDEINRKAPELETVQLMGTKITGGD